jgi:hypothetical protein
MKKRKGIFILLIVTFIIVAISGVAGFDVLSGLLFGGSGITLLAAGGIVGPGTGVDGTLTQEELKDAGELTQEDLNRLIVKIRPSDVPLDTLTREIGNVQSCQSTECGGYEIGTRDIQDTVIENYAGGTDVADIKVGKKAMWQINETVFVPDVLGGDLKPLMLYVVGKDNVDSTLKVIAVNGIGLSSELPALPAETKLLRLGKAMSELTAQADPFAALPSTRKNYTQIHMTQVEVSMLSELQKKKVALDFSTHRELAIWDLKRSMELTNLFGVKGKFTNPEKNNEIVYTSDGLWNQLTYTSEYNASSAPTNNTFVELTREIFDGNNGSDRRVLLAGPILLQWLSQVDSYSKQVEAKNVEVVHGVKFNRIETNFGELLVKSMSGLFVGDMAQCGMVLDMSYIVKYIYENLQTTPLDLDKTGTRRAKAVRIHENYALFAENLEVHRKIRPSGSTSTTAPATTSAATTSAATTDAATTGA